MADKAFLTVRVLLPFGLAEQYENVSSVNVRIDDGSFLGIRPQHAKMITAVQAGELKLTIEDKTVAVAIPDGVLIVEKNVVRVLTTG